MLELTEILQEIANGVFGEDTEEPAWNEEWHYRIKQEPEPTYPIYKQFKATGLVVKFNEINSGEVILAGATNWGIGEIFSGWVEHTNSDVWQDWTPITKSKPTIHCLAYDAKRFDHEQTTAVRVRVVKKEVAEANGWHIIQEWEV